MVYRNDITAAVLRVSSSLDLVTVLQEVVDSARALTGARYGLIVTVDRAASVEECVTSGLAAGEKERLAHWPAGPRLFAHFRDLAGPLRIPDLPAYVRALGFSADLMQSKTLQAAPMRHRGALVGLVFLGEKREGLEFTGDDEEVLMLFTALAEFPMAQLLSSAKTVRAEEMTLSVPDGRSVTTLVNASPIRSPDGAVERVVVALQDLAPLEEGTKRSSGPWTRARPTTSSSRSPRRNSRRACGPHYAGAPDRSRSCSGNSRSATTGGGSPWAAGP